MRCKATVTFEYATRQPQTHCIDAMEATGPQTIASRALRDAKRQLRPVYWTSLVVVLERLDAVADDAVDQNDADESENEVEDQ